MGEEKSKTSKTRESLLLAATEVFAAKGIAGATTREIAKTAGVNEVTLFRHFQSKEQLLEAVVERATVLQREALANPDEWTQDLKTDLKHYAYLYAEMLTEQEPLIRMFLGEATRHPASARKILSEASQNLWEGIVQYLRQGKERGIILEDIDPVLAVEQFTGMLLAGMLRSAIISRSYTEESYIEACVELFVRGISVLPQQKGACQGTAGRCLGRTSSTLNSSQ